ncbi:AAA_23 domain-containing protein [Vibrio chagasii]|nr:AAA_23 domain-containing protein [Vibrio chagasii]
MKLKSISIVNFRQFWNEVKIDFSVDSHKNVTVIHGANGSGKTSLLNAFKWCFYGKTDFDTDTDNILNETAIQAADVGQDIELKVKVIFEELGCLYEVVRSARYRKSGEMAVENLNLIEFVIMKIDESGSASRVEAPNSEINRVLPETLQPYFFFNGERIEKLAGVNESSQIKEAIKKLMGLKQVERAQRHLDKVSKIYRSEVARQQDPKTQSLVDRIERLEGSIEDITELLQRERDELKLVDINIARVDKKLEAFKEVKFLQKRRKELDELNKQIEDDLGGVMQERKALLDGYRGILLARPIIEQCRQLVDENRKKGVLPYKVRAPFIDDLLAKCECICGRHIDEASKSALESARKQAGDDDLDSAYMAVTSFLNSYESNTQHYSDSAKLLTERFQELSNRRRDNSIELTEISVQLQNSEDIKVVGYEQQRKDLEIKRTSHLINIEKAQSDLQSSEPELRALKKEWDKNQKQAQSHNLKLKRLESTSNIHSALEKLNLFFTEKVREDLSLRVSDTFDSIIRKNMRAYIDEDFLLRVEKRTPDGAYDAKEQSTGEKQVTSLSFIASIISLAKEKHTTGGKFFKGGLYPLVMDSPFGALDDDYRFKVAENISLLADQVVIFVSNSQWNGNVRRACEDKVGNCYKLVHYTNSLSAKQAEHSDFLRYSGEVGEYSAIEEVAI